MKLCVMLPALLALALPACSDEPAAGGDDGSTGDPATSTSGEDPSVASSTSTGEPDLSTDGTSSSSSAGETSSESTDTTGEEADLLSFDLVVQRDVAGDEQLFSYRVSDGVADRLARLHEQDAGRDWTSPQFLSGRRVLMEVQDPGGNELRIAHLDEPSQTVRLDVPTKPTALESGAIVLTDESVLYGNDGLAHRVWLEDLHPIDRVPWVSYGGSFAASVDPLGRYIVVQASGAASTLRVSLDDATATPLAGSSFVPHLSVDGIAGLRGRDAEDGIRRLEYVPLADAVGTPLDLLPEIQAGQLPTYAPSADNVRPHPTAHGIAVTVTAVEGDTTLHYIGVEDGLALPAVLLDGPEVSGEFHGPFAGSGWSPDGRWLGFEVYTEAGYEVWLAEFGDGHKPELTLVAPAGPQWWPSFIWAPDSSALYIGHPWSDSKTPPRTERVMLTGKEPIVQAIGESRSHPLALSPDGTSLVYMQWEGDDASENRSLHLIDVSGPEPGEPSLLAVSPPGGSVDDVAFSPDGRVVAYGSDDGVMHLMLASLDEPERPHVEVTDAIAWWFAPSSK